VSRVEVFRDDDIGVMTDIGKLERAHEIIVSAGKTHTVAVLMKDICDNFEVWWFLHNAKNLNVQLHGWTHKAYDGLPWWDNSGKYCDGLTYDEIMSDLRESLDYWKNISKRGCYRIPPLTTFYPPWNRVSDLTLKAAAACGLTVDARHGKGTPVFLFDYWDSASVELLRKAVRDG
jgi:hypothetical protein